MINIKKHRLGPRKNIMVSVGGIDMVINNYKVRVEMEVGKTHVFVNDTLVESYPHRRLSFITLLSIVDRIGGIE